jgi:predicted nucleic acid-binding protein
MRRRRIDKAQIIEYLDLLGRLPIRVEFQPWMDSVRLESAARRWNLAAYDAAYLSLALKRGIPLATSDAALSAKAIEIGVGILS